MSDTEKYDFLVYNDKEKITLFNVQVESGGGDTKEWIAKYISEKDGLLDYETFPIENEKQVKDWILKKLKEISGKDSNLKIAKDELQIMKQFK